MRRDIWLEPSDLDERPQPSRAACRGGCWINMRLLGRLLEVLIALAVTVVVVAGVLGIVGAMTGGI